MRCLLLLALLVAGCGTVVDPRAFIPMRPVVVWVDEDTGCHWYRLGPAGEYLVPRRNANGVHICGAARLPEPGASPRRDSL